MTNSQSFVGKTIGYSSFIIRGSFGGETRLFVIEPPAFVTPVSSLSIKAISNDKRFEDGYYQRDTTHLVTNYESKLSYGKLPI